MDFLIGFGAIAIIVIVVLITSAVKESKCPKCGKAFAMYQASSKIVNARSTTMDINRKITTRMGDIIGKYTETVPATEFFYDCVDKCQYCGFSHHVSRRKTVRD